MRGAQAQQTRLSSAVFLHHADTCFLDCRGRWRNLHGRAVRYTALGPGVLPFLKLLVSVGLTRTTHGGMLMNRALSTKENYLLPPSLLPYCTLISCLTVIWVSSFPTSAESGPGLSPNSTCTCADVRLCCPGCLLYPSQSSISSSSCGSLLASPLDGNFVGLLSLQAQSCGPSCAEMGGM